MLHPSKDGVFGNGHYWLKKGQKSSVKLERNWGEGVALIPSSYHEWVNFLGLYEVNDFIKTSFSKPNSLMLSKIIN